MLCRKASGQVVVADQCPKRSTPLDPAAAGLVGPPGEAGLTGAPGERRQVPSKVLDATGKQVGVVLSNFFDQAQVVLGSGLPAPIQIVVSRGQVQPPYAQILYYQTTDCTGTPALYSGAGPLPRGQILGSVLYYPTSPRTADRPFMSTETEQTPCGGTPTPRGTCCTTQARSESPADAASIPLSTLGLTLPFTVVASP